MPAEGQVPDFTRIALKYQDLSDFTKAAKTTFAKGRMTLKSKKDLKEGDRIILAVKISDRKDTIEIIAQVIQRVNAATEGKPNAYGVRWLNFSEKRLKKLEEGDAVPSAEKKPAAPEPPHPPAPPEPPPPGPKKTDPEPAAKTSKKKEPPPEPPRISEPAPPEPPPPPPPEPKRSARQKAPESGPPEPSPPPEPAAVKKKKPSAPEPSPPPPETTPPPEADGKQTADEKCACGDKEYTINASQASEYPSFRDEPEVIIPDAHPEEGPSPEEPAPAAPETAEPASLPEPAPETSEPAPVEFEDIAGAVEPEAVADTSLDVQAAPETAADEAAGLFEPDIADQVQEKEARGHEPDEPPEDAIPLSDEEGPGTMESESSLHPEEAGAGEPMPGEAANAGSFERSEYSPPTSDEIIEADAIGSAPVATESAVREESPPPGEKEPSADTEPAESEPDLPGADAKESGAEVRDDLPDESCTPETAPADLESADSLAPGPAGLDEYEAEPAEEEAPSTEAREEPAEDEAEEVVAGHVLKPLSSEELETLGSFLMKLLKLLLMPQKAMAPDSEKSINSLYDEFKTVMSGRDEIVIYVRSAGAVKEYMLAGDVLNPVNLKNSLPPERFDALAIKLVDFFERKKLVGIQFRRYLTGDAFRQFVLRMGNYDPSHLTPEDLAAGLIQEGVFHISPVHEDDRVSDAGALDFRVDMTLSRLRGDLKRLKLVAEAMMEEDPAAVWTLRVEDAMKFLHDGRLRAEVLLHGDMVVEGQDVVSESEFMQEVIFATPVEMLAVAGKYLAEYYEASFAGKEPGESAPELEIVTRALRGVTARLMVDKPEVGTGIMYGLYKKGVFTLGELPPELRERVMLEQFIDTFLQEPEKRISDFSNIKNHKDYRIACNRYATMVVELVRRGNLEVADSIFRTLVGHIGASQHPFPERPQAARQAFTALGKPESVAVLTAALSGADKDQREKLAAMIYAGGPAAAGPLIELLRTEKDRSLRRLICMVLTRIGDGIAPELARNALDPEVPWYLLRNLIMIMGDIKSPLLKEDLDRLTGHDHPRVREEALVYATKVTGVQSEHYLAAALSDADAAVRRRSVRVLCRFSAIGDPTLAALLAMLAAKPDKDPPPEEEQAVCETVEFISRLGNRKLPDGGTVEETLIGIIETETSRGILGRLTSAKSNRTVKMRTALVSALGKIGGAKSKKALAPFMKDKAAEVKEAAMQALANIDGREK